MTRYRCDSLGKNGNRRQIPERRAEDLGGVNGPKWRSATLLRRASRKRSLHKKEQGLSCRWNYALLLFGVEFVLNDGFDDWLQDFSRNFLQNVGIHTEKYARDQVIHLRLRHCRRCFLCGSRSALRYLLGHCRRRFRLRELFFVRRGKFLRGRFDELVDDFGSRWYPRAFLMYGVRGAVRLDFLGIVHAFCGNNVRSEERRVGREWGSR